MTPLEASIIYISKSTKQVIAWDEITRDGLGQAYISIRRKENPIGAPSS